MNTGYFSFYNNEFGYGAINNITTDDTIIIDTFDESLKALHGDKVQYNNNKITKIIERNNNIIYGVLFTTSNIILGTKRNIPLKRFKPCSEDYPDFMVPVKDSIRKHDLYVGITFNKWINTKYPIGAIKKIIGKVGNIKAEKQYLKYRNNIIWKPIKIDYINHIDLTPNRIDYTDLITFSIDPIYCKDIDDAFSIVVNNNEATVYIHIADPSSYILEGSELDLIIRSRTESVYLKYQQYNMLPDYYSFDICSLKKDVNRRSFTVTIKFDIINMKLLNIDYNKGVICNNYNFSYEEVNNILDTKDHSIIDSINNLYTLGYRLYKGRDYDSHKMVEVFMILTNRLVAEHMKGHCPNEGIFRIQRGSILNTVDEISNIIRSFNIQRAEYIIGYNNKLRHDALDIDMYTHFTSPIRRYCDILVHRILYNSITNKKVNNYNNIIDNINKGQSNIRKAQYESNILDFIYNVNNNHDSLLESYGYIIHINDNKIYIYLNKYKIIVHSYIFSNKVKDIIKYDSNEQQLIIYNNNRQFIISISDKVFIRIVISSLSPYFSNKMIVQLIDPDPLEFIKKN
jgi:exoribonuclease R